MEKKLSSYTALIGFLSLITLLTLNTLGQAQTIDKWTGSVSFTGKETTEGKDTSGNTKLVTPKILFQGTMSLYNDPNVGPVQGPDGCMLELLNSGGVKICFDEIIAVNSENRKTGKGSFLLVGTGNMTSQGEVATCIAYINGKGSLVLDSSKNLISLSLGGALGVGCSPEDNPPSIFTGTIPTTTLTK